MSEEKIISYKGFDKDMKCRGFQFEVGKEYEESEADVCNKGFHACENPFDVLNYYNDVDGKYCIVEQSGKIDRDRCGSKIASSKIRLKAEMGFVGLFKAGVEWIKTITNPKAVIEGTRGKGDNPSGDYAQIGSSGYYARIGSSGDYAKIKSTGEHAVVCCAGHNSIAKAKVGSWITLSEWVYSRENNNYVPKCVKTEYVDGERIKEDTWYELVDGEFKEVV